MQAVYVENNNLIAGTEVDPPPPVAENQVRIKVAYAGVNYADILQTQGKYPLPQNSPAILGLEVSGEIVEGEKFKRGQKVCALLLEGGYGEYVNAEADLCIPIDDNYPLEKAACLPEALATAWLALVEHGGLKAGHDVLIHGGASGVGIIAAQMAQHLGANIWVSASMPKKIEHLKNMGLRNLNCASPEHLLESAGEQKFDILLDILGGKFTSTNLKLLRYGGIMVTIACMSDGDSNINIGSILMKNLRWHGMTLRSQPSSHKADIMAKIHKNILPAVQNGSIEPHIHAIFPLDKAKEAHNMMVSREHIGKILLKVSSDAK